MSEHDEQQLDEIIADYLQAQETGRTVSEQEVIAAHPELAAELREFFDDLEQMNDLAAPVAPQQPVLDKIRYFGDYELLEEIARGGMGIVYKAKQTSLNRVVAVKLILSGHLASETDVKRFQTEAESAANLQHPHIVSVFEVGRHQGQSYFSMEYIDGKNLSEIVRDHPLPPSQAAGYVREVAEAIQYAHQQGTLHRDLKPSNVLIDQNDRVQITDFGLAMKVEGDSELTRTGQVLGTPSYMPPEQAQHKRGLIGPGSDVYSLGAVLYELLTGRPPFQADTAVETMRQVIETEPLSPRLLNPAVPKDLETICLKCLQKEPHKRYATAQELADDLGRFLQGEPILARPVGRAERAWRWCRRHRMVASLSAVSLILLIAISGLTTWGYIRESGLRSELQTSYSRLTNEQSRSKRFQKDLRSLKVETGRLETDIEKMESQRTKLQDNLKTDRLKLDERQQKLYDSTLQLARLSYRENRIGLADYYLNQCPETYRDEAWHQLRRELRPKVTVFDGQYCVAISPDGRLLAGGGTKQVRVWELESQRLVYELTGHDEPVRSIAFSPDGKWLASAGGTQVLLWRLEEGELEHTFLDHHHRVTDVEFSPRGGVLASTSYKYTRAQSFGQLIMWNLETFEPMHYGGMKYCKFSPDGQRIATLRQEGVEILQLPNEHNDQFTRIKLRPTELDSGHSPVFHPQKQLLATVHSWSSKVHTWNSATGEQIISLPSQHPVNGLAYSPDGHRMAVFGSTQGWIDPARHEISIQNLLTERQERKIPWNAHPIREILFSPDGQKLVTADDHEIKVWDIPMPHSPTLEILAGIAAMDVGRFDWPQWGGSPSRVNTPAGKNIPSSWNVGDSPRSRRRRDTPGPYVPENSRNVKWAVPLGSQTYGNPVVANGRIYLGTNNAAGYVKRFPPSVDLGVLLCLKEDTGEFLWQHSNPKLRTGRVHDWPWQGVCSTPVVDGDRLWYVSNRGEVVCLDTRGFYDGSNDGVFQDEPHENLDEADVLWKFDMMGELGVSQHNMANCSMLNIDGKLFVCTSNGLDESHISLPAPEAPSFIAMDRDTGEVLWTDNSPGQNILHAQWASPSYGVFDGQPQVIFPGGDGWVYSFDPNGDGRGNSRLLWKFDGNRKDTKWVLGGSGTRNNIIAFPAIYDGLVYIAMGQDPEHGEGLGQLWCIDPSKHTDGRDVSADLAVDQDGQIMPHRRLQAVEEWNRIYYGDSIELCAGLDEGRVNDSLSQKLRRAGVPPGSKLQVEEIPVDPPSERVIGKWLISAVEDLQFRVTWLENYRAQSSVRIERATGERAIPNPDSAVVWEFSVDDRNGDGRIDFEEEFHRSISIPVIKDDILYTADFSGIFYCMNAKTGKAYWTYDMFANCWGSPLLVDGKVFVCDEDGDVTIFRHSSDPHVATRPVVREGQVEYVPSENGIPGDIINEVYMRGSTKMTPIVANNVLYIATLDTLYAIEERTSRPALTIPQGIPDDSPSKTANPDESRSSRGSVD